MKAEKAIGFWLTRAPQRVSAATRALTPPNLAFGVFRRQLPCALRNFLRDKN
jgi:hypothetical protein